MDMHQNITDNTLVGLVHQQRAFTALEKMAKTTAGKTIIVKTLLFDVNEGVQVCQPSKANSGPGPGMGRFRRH